MIALLAAVFFGVTGSASWPHGWLESTPQNSWGPVPLESWLIAGGLYVVLVAVARAVVPNVKSALAFSRQALAAAVPPDAVVDLASEAEGRVPAAAPAAGSA